METVRFYRLDHLPRAVANRLREAQMEAARVWMLYPDLHQAARQNRLALPTRDDLQQATKGMFALHSQAVQMICHSYHNQSSTRSPQGSGLVSQYARPAEDSRAKARN